MEKQPKFKIGDKVTYLDSRKIMPKQDYRFGGLNQDGYIGTIKAYSKFLPNYDCFEIKVSTKGNNNYSMLESEFKEYYTNNLNNSDYEIY